MSLPDPNSEAWLDAKLRDVALPVGLSVRLQSMATYDDAQLNALLRDVPIPTGLQRHLERIGERGTRFDQVLQFATAASVFVAVGLAYLGVVIALMISVIPPTPLEPPLLNSSFALNELEVRWSDETVLDVVALQSARSESRADIAEIWPDAPQPRIAWENPTHLPDSPVADLRSLLFGSDVDLMADVHTASWPTSIRASDQLDPLPDLKKVPGLKPRGINFPLVPGYDIAMLSRTGFHPFVPPFASTELCHIEVPLGIDTASYDLLCRYLEDGQLPPRESLRTEEFLAAIDFRFPAPKKQALSLHVAGGPAPFRPEGMQLLQIGIRAKEVTVSKRRPVRLTLCVDVSASMRFGGRLAMVRNALEGLTDQFQADDRINLVMFGEDSHVLAEGLCAEDKAQFSEAIALLTAKGTTHLGGGLRQAFAVARRSTLSDRFANRVVLLTDGQAQLDSASVLHVARRLREAAAEGIRFDVIDLRQPSPGEEVESQLALLASEGNGQVHRVTGVRQIGWALEEILGDQSRLVAKAVRLSIEMNPQTVGAYRLFGHEPLTVIGLTPARLETDFHSGQSATALFELHWKQNPENDVARITLSWKDPASGHPQTATRVVRRGQFTANLIDAPLSLQEAAVVASASEVLRASPYSQAWTNPEALSNVIRLAEQLDTRLFERPDLSEYLSVIERATRAKPSRAGGKRSPFR